MSTEIVLKTGEIISSDKVHEFFYRVFEAEASGERFPCDLDLFWPMAYTTKGNARTALTEMHFVEGEDYVLLLEKQKQKGSGGHNAVKVMMTVQCVEHLVARKVGGIFEIYRQCRIERTEAVKARPEAEPPAIPDDPLLALLQATVSMRQEQIAMERRLVAAEEVQAKQREQIGALGRSIRYGKGFYFPSPYLRGIGWSKMPDSYLSQVTKELKAYEVEMGGNPDGRPLEPFGRFLCHVFPEKVLLHWHDRMLAERQDRVEAWYRPRRPLKRDDDHPQLFQ